MEPTLRAGLPQLIVLVGSVLVLTMGIQVMRWLRFHQRVRRLRRRRLAQLREQAPESGVTGPTSLSLPVSGEPGPEDGQLPRNPGGYFRVIKSLLLVAGSTLVCFSGDFALSAEQGARQFVRELPVADIEVLRLVAGNGSIHVSQAQDSLLRIELEVDPDRFSGDEDRGILSWFLTSRYDDVEQIMSSMALDVSRSGQTVTVRPTPRGRTRENTVRERWRLSVPPELQLRISAAAAEVDISGLSGGVAVDIEYGHVNADLLAGSADITVVNGRIALRSAARDWRQLAVRTTVGDSRIYVEGRRLQYQDPPGPGSRVTLEGRGEDTFQLRTEVGDIEVRFE